MNTAPSNLSELWSIPVNGALDTRPIQFRPNFCSNRLASGSADAGLVRKRREIDPPDDDSTKGVCNAMSNSDGKRLKMTLGSRDDDNNVKACDDSSSRKEAEPKSTPTSEAPKDYIHVRARRGQATDSHSLAERARREKISQRMRILQDLVPGCNKVIGKALVLDEIINYIQSLQRQVEFLSMKLEAVNSRIAPYMEGFPGKDFGQREFDTSRTVYSSQICEPSREYDRGLSPEWLHIQLGGGFGRQT